MRFRKLSFTLSFQKETATFRILSTLRVWQEQAMYTYNQAKKLADEFVYELKPSCKRIEIVGSLRRRQAHVNDVDIIVIPTFSMTADQTLFGDPVRQNLFEMKITDLCAGGHITLQTNGPKIKRLFKKCLPAAVPAGRQGKEGNSRTIPIDIYVADEQTWWTLKLIRTGSRNHNVALASQAIRKHMVLKADGTGLLSAGGNVISIDSEEAIFQHLGLSYRRPEERE
jgi:DNA polymerase/3'-5' exonuclease PolX